MHRVDQAPTSGPWQINSRKFGTTAAVVILLVGAVFTLYRNTLEAPFLLDDLSSIQNNLSIRHLWPLENAAIGGTRGRPGANFSFALNYVWGGNRLASYHWTNLALHAASALILFGLIRRTLRQPVFNQIWTSAADTVAASAALLWAVHPLQTEAVTYLSQRTELLMGLCYLTTLYCFVRAVTSMECQRVWYGLAVLACGAGMAVKEVMVTAPVAVLLYDRAFVAGGWSDALRTRRRFYLGLGLSWGVLAGLMFDLGERGVGFGLGASPFHYALTESCVVLNYLRLAVWPTPLVFDYGTGTAPSLAEVWPCVLAVLGVIAAVLAALCFRPALGFVLAWPFLILAPTSSFVPIAQQPMAEQRLYLPLAGLAVAAVLLLWRAAGNRAWWAVALLSLALSYATVQRNEIYSNPVDLWRDTVEKRPANDRAQLNLAVAYLKDNRRADARRHLSRALELNPANAQAWINLGVLCAQTGQLAEAFTSFEKAAHLEPGLAEAHYNLGWIFLKTGRYADAAKSFVQAIRLNPDYSDAHNNLATILISAGKYQAAIAHYSQAIRVSPSDAEIYANRAEAYLHLGQRAEALADYRAALLLRPDFEAVRRQLESLRTTAEK